MPSVEQSVALSVEYGFREKEELARMYMSFLLMHLGHYDRAREEVERALGLVRETDNQDVEADLWSGLGYLVLIPGDNPTEARAFFEKGLRLSEQVQDQVSVGIKLSGLLLAACQVGAEDKAWKYSLTYLEYVVRVREYVDLIEALPAVAYYLAHFGGKQQALAIWQQVRGQPYISASQWYQDVIGREIEALTADLVPESTPAVTSHDLWLTAELLLADLQ